ncbi:hypothetical protein [Burkholderia sp. MSMB1826]|uniref:hypothetical protein n=1 Tax=Burkholderia sp. MSMB1826 TaxID=1637875 RepID=UPI00359C7810
MHLVRNSLGFTSWKGRKSVAEVPKEVSGPRSPEAAAVTLDALDTSPWGTKHPRPPYSGVGPEIS